MVNRNKPENSVMAQFCPFHKPFNWAISGFLVLVVVGKQFLVNQRPTAKQQNAVDKPDDAAPCDVEINLLSVIS